MKKQSKISEAFPEINEDSVQFRSSIHNMLNEHKYEIDLNSFSFHHKITKEEAKLIKDYHDEWFPIKYSDRFYVDLYQQLRTSIIVLKADVIFKNKNEKQQIIIGLITYRFQEVEMQYLSFAKKIKSFFKDYQCCHICTLGVLFEFRKLKIGSKLLKYLEENVLKNKNLQYIYLETTNYNKAAIKFYLKNGYKISHTSKNFYYFNENHYDACFIVKNV